jgi:hypothetical protein
MTRAYRFGEGRAGLGLWGGCREPEHFKFEAGRSYEFVCVYTLQRIYGIQRVRFLQTYRDIDLVHNREEYMQAPLTARGVESEVGCRAARQGWMGEYKSTA